MFQGVSAEVEYQHLRKRICEGIETYLTASSARLPPRLSGSRKKLVEISPAVTSDAVRIVNWAIPVAYSIHSLYSENPCRRSRIAKEQGGS
jgi:hypothetical protein